MRLIKHDVNKRLLALITILLLIFSIAIAYYGYKFRSVMDKKAENDEKISEITAQLILEKYNKLDKSKATELESIDKLILEQKYKEAAAQNEKLKREIEDLSALKDEINILKSQIEYHNARLEGPVAQFRLIQEKNQQIMELKEKVDNLCLMVKSFKNISLKDSSFYSEECG